MTGLTPGTRYTLAVRATDQAGNDSAPSSAVAVTTDAAPDTTAPSAPGGPIASDVTSSSVTLSWTASTDDVGVAGYRVFERSGAVDLEVASTTGGTSLSLTGLTEATTYVFLVKAQDAAGNVSQGSSTVTVTTRTEGGGSSSSGGTSSGGGRENAVVAAGCSTVPASGGGGWLLVLAAVAVRRRAVARPAVATGRR